MRDSGFPDLVDQLFGLARMEKNMNVRDVANLYISDIHFILMDGSTVEEGSMIFLCDFGEVPKTHRTDVLQRLLEANLVMLGVGTPCFSINYETNHVLLMGRVLIEKTPARVLFRAFVQHARQAKQWRKTRFLLGKEHEAVHSEEKNDANGAPKLKLVTRAVQDRT